MAELVENGVKNKREFYTQVTMKLFEDITPETDTDLDIETIREILNDVDVSSLVNKISRTVASRELQVWTDDEELKDKADEINSRFAQVKFNRFYDNILQARYFGYSCFEKVYNEDYSLNSLIYIPPDYVKYETSDKKWYVVAGGEQTEITYDKFILALNKYNIVAKKGKSEFSSIKQCFQDKVKFRKQLRNITERYGEIIFVFAYDPEEYKKKGDLEEKVQQIRKMKSNTVIATPYIDGVVSKDSVNLIKLSDLQPTIYNELEENEIQKLTQNMLGGTLTMNNGNGTGSYSLGQIHQEAFEQVIKECSNFITDTLYTLIEYDAQFFGYEAKDFYFKLEPYRDIEKETDLDQKQETVKSLQLDNMLKMYQLGVGLDPEYIARQLGIDKKEIQQIQQNTNKTAEFEGGQKKNKFVEKVRTIRDKAIDKACEDVKKFTKNVNKSYEKWAKNDIINTDLNLDFEDFEKRYLLTVLKGYVDSFDVDLIKEFAGSIDVFDMPFDKAIESLSNKAPKLYENLDNIREQVHNDIFYIKRSTELESTKKTLNELKNTLKSGGTYRDFANSTKDVSEKTGMTEDGWYSNLVYRQNMANAYAEGQYLEQIESAEQYPYWYYDGVRDERQTELCAALDGQVFMANDPIWATIYPPNHFNCRSGVTSLDDEKMKTWGLNITKSTEKSIDLFKENLGTFAGSPKDLAERLGKRIPQLESDIYFEKVEIRTKFYEQLFSGKNVDDITRELMNSQGVTNLDLKVTAKYENFSKNLAEAVDTNLEYGGYVDKQGAEATKHYLKYIDTEKKCGVAIKEDGDITCVFKKISSNKRKAVDDLILTARENGGTKMDCYGKILVNSYEKCGFKVVARVDYNEEFANTCVKRKPCDVYVLMRTNDSTKEVLEKRAKGLIKISNDSDLEKVKHFDKNSYEKAIKFRDDLLKKSFLR